MRRQFDVRHHFDSLVPIQSLKDRAALWKSRTAKTIKYFEGDTREYPLLSRVIKDVRPQAIIHFAEQRAAPYSMIDREHAVFTMDNNVIGTLNVLYAMKELCPDCHLVKLGTMGEYGTPNIDVEEGFIEIRHKGRRDRLPYPKNPSSFYHLSKVHDSHNIMFACKTWNLRATDLNQGVVYGIETPETRLDPGLATRFDYDQIYGTVLNRFCAQAAAGHALTVYGQGGQTRGYIYIEDTVKCIEIAVKNPASPGEFRVFNQFSETFTVNQLADHVKQSAKSLGLKATVVHMSNPRVEAEKHYYKAVNTSLLKLGLRPWRLQGDLLKSILKKAMDYSARINTKLLDPSVDWRKTKNKI